MSFTVNGEPFEDLIDVDYPLFEGDLPDYYEDMLENMAEGDDDDPFDVESQNVTRHLVNAKMNRINAASFSESERRSASKHRAFYKQQARSHERQAGREMTRLR